MEGNIGSCVLKPFAVECWSILSMDTLDQRLIYTQSTLHRHLIWQSINISVCRSTVSWESTNITRMMCHMCQSRLSQLATGCWSSVDRVLSTYQLRWRSRVAIKSIHQHLISGAFNTHPQYVHVQCTVRATAYMYLVAFKHLIALWCYVNVWMYPWTHWGPMNLSQFRKSQKRMTLNVFAYSIWPITYGFTRLPT